MGQVKTMLNGCIIFFIKTYQYLLSPWLGACCRFTPSCSEYAVDAVKIHGAWRGLWLAGGRLLRCQPWGGCGEDLVPGKAGAKPSN